LSTEAPRALHRVALSSYTALYVLDQVHTKPEPEVQAEQAQAEGLTNLDLDQSKPRCIYALSLSFVYNLILFMILGYVLGHRSWIDALVE
jgi:hypothetical protein